MFKIALFFPLISCSIERTMTCLMMENHLRNSMGDIPTQAYESDILKQGQNEEIINKFAIYSE